MTCKHAVGVENQYICPKCWNEAFKKAKDKKVKELSLRLHELEEEDNKNAHIGNTDFGFGKIQM